MGRGVLRGNHFAAHIKMPTASDLLASGIDLSDKRNGAPSKIKNCAPHIARQERATAESDENAEASIKLYHNLTTVVIL